MLITKSKRFQSASSETVRDINRRIVLNLIRIRQPLSRADLARLSGLQRSTISLIVDDLIAEEWVLEGPTGRLPKGRRPTYLRLNDQRVIIAIDIRPEHTTIAVADVNGKFTFQEVLETLSEPESAIAGLIVRLRQLRRSTRGKKVEGIGINLPGRIGQDSGRLVFAPNLKWPEYDVRTPIAEATGLDVEVQNAASACVLAAAWFDHIESRNIVVVTVSEGIGTGILVDGRLVRGAHGLAGEFGHMPLDSSGPICGCGNRGCWEVFGSNRAALRYYFGDDAVRDGLKFLDLLSLAEQGDDKAAAALETMARYLGRGMRMLIAGLDPEQILVIGELTRSWHRFGPVIEAELRAQILSKAAASPVVVPVHEGGMARLRGAVASVLQKHFGRSPLSPLEVEMEDAFLPSFGGRTV